MTQLHYGDLIHLHSAVNKKFVSAERNGDLVADRRLAGDYECFTMESLTLKIGDPIRFNDKIQIRSGVGRKLITISITGTPYANRDYASQMETFLILDDNNPNSTEIITTNSRVRFIAHHNKVLACEPDGTVCADRSEWEYSYDVFDFVVADMLLQQEYNRHTIELQQQNRLQNVTTQLQNVSLEKQQEVNPFDDPFDDDLDKQHAQQYYPQEQHQEYQRQQKQYQTTAKPTQVSYRQQQETDFFDEYDKHQQRPQQHKTSSHGHHEQTHQQYNTRPPVPKTTTTNNALDFEFDQRFYQNQDQNVRKEPVRPVQKSFTERSHEKPQEKQNVQKPNASPVVNKGKRRFELRPTQKNDHIAHVSILNENGALIYKVAFQFGDSPKIDLTNGSNVPSANIAKVGLKVHSTFKIKHANGSRMGECTQRFKMTGIGEEKKFNYQRLDNSDIFKLTGLYGSNWKVSKDRRLVGSVTDDKKGYILEIDSAPSDIFHVLAQTLIMILSRYIEEAQKPKTIQNFNKAKTMY
jgi:hypothetical protein